MIMMRGGSKMEFSFINGQNFNLIHRISCSGYHGGLFINCLLLYFLCSGNVECLLQLSADGDGQLQLGGGGWLPSS